VSTLVDYEKSVQELYDQYDSPFWREYVISNYGEPGDENTPGMNPRDIAQN